MCARTQVERGKEQFIAADDFHSCRQASFRPLSSPGKASMRLIVSAGGMVEMERARGVRRPESVWRNCSPAATAVGGSCRTTNIRAQKGPPCRRTALRTPRRRPPLPLRPTQQTRASRRRSPQACGSCSAAFPAASRHVLEYQYSIFTVTLVPTELGACDSKHAAVYYNHSY